jgi:hypothetical protein
MQRAKHQGNPHHTSNNTTQLQPRRAASPAAKKTPQARNSPQSNDALKQRRHEQEQEQERHQDQQQEQQPQAKTKCTHLCVHVCKVAVVYMKSILCLVLAPCNQAEPRSKLIKP